MICVIAKYIITKLTCSYDKIIFLDFDGVMCPINDDVDADIDKYGTLFDTDCANLLNDIIVATNANIVITSSWRQYLSLWQLRRMWKRRMMKGEIIGITPIQSIHRGKEIDAWLSKNNCHKYVILDDMNDMQFNHHHTSSLVVCDGRKGISYEDAQRAINILSR